MTNKISWFGTLASISGSFIVAMQYYKIGYVLFLLGSISWLVVAVVKQDKALGVLNGAFLLANLLGLYKTFF